MRQADFFFLARAFAFTRHTPYSPSYFHWFVCAFAWCLEWAQRRTCALLYSRFRKCTMNDPLGVRFTIQLENNSDNKLPVFNIYTHSSEIEGPCYEPDATQRRKHTNQQPRRSCMEWKWIKGKRRTTMFGGDGRFSMLWHSRQQAVELYALYISFCCRSLCMLDRISVQCFMWVQYDWFWSGAQRDWAKTV